MPENYQSNKPRVVYALDFDGTFLTTREIDALSKSTIPPTEEQLFQLCLEMNPWLTQMIQSDIDAKHYKQLLLSIFTSRQSKRIDENNYQKLTSKRSWVNAGSCFGHYKQLADSFEGSLTLNPLLLTDCFNGETLGTSLHRITDASYTGPHKDCPFEFKKLLLIYMHAHYYASTYPGELHIIKVIDDNLDILQSIADYYSRNPILLPVGVSIVLLQRTATGKIEHFNDLAGTGEMDPYYPVTLQEWVKLAGVEDWLDNSYGNINVAYVEATQILDFRMRCVKAAEEDELGFSMFSFFSKSQSAKSDTNPIQETLDAASVYGSLETLFNGSSLFSRKAPTDEVEMPSMHSLQSEV
ncbi:MAG: hypothetical protein NTW08_10065 [Gammaproteobacteria bacterium]|nr:hypothetical protein [Gammaproteobacteria bacterium]